MDFKARRYRSSPVWAGDPSRSRDHILLGCVCTLALWPAAGKHALWTRSLGKLVVQSTASQLLRCIWMILCTLNGIVSLYFSTETHLAPRSKCTLLLG